MTEQLGLLDYPTRKMSRATDPPSSDAAARSGDKAAQRALILNLVRADPGRTAKEYDAMLPDSIRFNRPSGKRLPELRALGLVYSASIGNREQRWFLGVER